MKTENCERCGKGFEYEAQMIGGREFGRKTVCPGCLDEDKAKENLAKHDKLWAATCPELYRGTDRLRLPKAQTDEVMAWKFGSKGMLLHGPSRSGKTRASLLLARRLIYEGREVEFFYGNRFGAECASKFRQEEGEAWIAELAREDVVFFDDVGKFKFTERVEAEFFCLFEMRIGNMKPTIFTTNADGGALRSKMTDDRGEPFVMRLREFCEMVEF